jgi:hypothetical protein
MKNTFRLFFMFAVAAGLILLVSAHALPSARAAGPWYVSNSGNIGNDCASSTTPCYSINGALNKPGFVAGDTVNVAVGTYTGTGPGFTSQVALIDKSTTLSGGWNTTFTNQTGLSTIDGQNAQGGIRVNSGVIASISHFIVTNSWYYPGIYNEGTFAVSNSSIQSNSNRGIYNHYTGNLTVNNTSVSNNTGEGIYSYGGSLNLNNATISNNSGYQGGGIYSGGVTLIKNSIIAGNAVAGYGSVGPDCFGAITSTGNNILSTTSGCTFASASGDQLNINPQLGIFLPIQGYQPLLPTSPAINAGNPLTCLPTDQRGLSRVGICDIGAIEYMSPGSAVGLFTVGGSNQRTAPIYAFSKPLQAVALDSQGNPVNGVSITYTAPGGGASGIFANGGARITTVNTDSGGVATTSIFTANDRLGSYTVSASASGLSAINFNLMNVAWYVSNTGNDADSCASPAFPCVSFNAAIGKDQAGDRILVATGTYTGTGTEVVLIEKKTTLSGGWNAAFTIQNGYSTIDGQNARGGVFVNGLVFASLDHFIVRNGYRGGGWGAGILNNSGMSGMLILSNMNISNNSAGDGGGIYNRYGVLSVNDSSIHDNSAVSGGGIVNDTGNLTLNNTTINNNTAIYGGGIHSYGGAGTVILNNVTVSNNNASTTGGAVVASTTGGGNLFLNNSTISQNTATGGSGIEIDSGTVTTQNTIIAGNGGGNVPDCNSTYGGVLQSLGFNVVGNVSGCNFTSATGDRTGLNPNLGPLQNNGGPTLTHALLPGSPAINAGNPLGCADNLGNLLNTDQRGMPRVGRCDIGAYEFQGTIFNIFLPIILR